MQTTLLGIIRSETERRSAPAVLALKAARKRKDSSRFLRWYRAIRHELGEPLRLASMTAAVTALEGGQVVLWGRGHKSTEVAETLESSGMPANRIAFLDPDRWKALRRSPSGFLSHALYWIFMRFGMRLKLTSSTRPFIDNIATYIALKSSLQRTKKRYWIVIGDLSPQLIALCGAAREAKHTTIGWQIDFLDFKHFPVRPDFATVLNEAGVKLARRSVPTTKHAETYWRAAPAIKPLRLSFENVQIGVLLNAFADSATIQRLGRLQQRLQGSIEVRLHPRSKLNVDSFPEGLQDAPRSESLEGFVDRKNLLICGNTSAQLKALCLGTPVAQLSGLDDLPFDHHGYISRGLIIGFKLDEHFSLQEIHRFYTARYRPQALRQLLGPKSQKRQPTLTDLVKRLNDSPGPKTPPMAH